MAPTLSSSPPEPIAMVGSGCRFPGGANSPSALWKLLEKPRDLGQEIPSDRFNTAGFYHANGARHGTTNVQHTYLLDEDVRVFDAPFFNISPNEADSIDPQQRLLLETVYEALEAGGHKMEALHGSDTAVYVGTMGVDYHETLLRDLNTIPTYFATGTNRAILSNRVSYFFDWHGPSMTLDTACSSSLIAVYLGVQALRSGETRVAVACGTQVILGPEVYIVESKLKMLSPTGRSRMWDADADGYARGEGVAAVVLKRLSDAIADGDHIECLIRETGANQDGFSNGLTVPSTDAQTALIRQTYARAGLDPENNPNDRPQFFEAHGTGTQAGDPKEAAAIHAAFGRHIHAANTTPLYVGSIKTVVGHLEGTAGLAGLLKASTSIQQGLIAPNLLFNRLNPRVEPFYKGLHVPTSLTKWPKLPDGVPRRVSVNSFGFGGANAHAILEEYMQPNSSSQSENLASENSKSSSVTPFLFSALSETSLVAILERYSEFLSIHQDDIDATDLAWTLHSRRSQLPVKAAFSARTVQELSSKIENKLATVKQNPGTAIGIRSKSTAPRVLGVFTGQGAQWAAMGAELIRSSNFVRQKIQHLEDSLATLPSSDRPQWSLKAEMLAGNDTSRIAEAALSQPLCTAIQIVLVDLLHVAGITFSAVVGHSSGEIAAAYAAGFLSAHDAIRVAYYRGLYARFAGNHATNQKGAMLAVGTSWEDAEDLVNLWAFKGRLAIAAHNSPASVTLSGDADAIVHAKKVFDEEKKFARLLKVDTAYHSHHMVPCGDMYVKALRACKIQVNRDRNNDCKWFSSVTPNAKGMQPIDELQDVYWRDNMTNAVLFADAVKNAISNDEQINLALEIGPHPALKGPATQNISDVRPAGLPYSGVLSRGVDDVVAFSDGLGFIWTLLGAKGVDLQSYETTVTDESCAPKLVVGLPSYQWNHGRIHWTESRKSRRIRGQKQAPHELLGTPSPDSNAHDMRWSNILKVSEISWLKGHQLQGQIVFPAAGYIAMAIEACRSLAADKKVELFELHDLSIPKAITFEDDDTFGVETLVTLTAIEYHQDQFATANLSIYSCPNTSMGSEHDMELMASGTMKISFGNPRIEALSSTPVEDYNMSAVDTDRFYAALTKLGYGYTDSFRGMSSMKRRLNRSAALVNTYAYTDDESTVYLVHPSMLDVAFHAAMLAYSAPSDERLWSLHVPTAIRTIRVNPEICALLPTSGSQVPVSAILSGDLDSFSASIDLFGEDGQQGMIQVEDLTLKPFAPATEADDRRLFSYTKLDVAAPDGAAVVNSIRPSADVVELGIVCERISYYYVRKWKLEITEEEWANGQPHHKYLRDFVDYVLAGASSGQISTLSSEWANDSAEDIKALIAKHSHTVDVKLLSAVGDNMPAAVRSQTTILEHMMADGLLDDFYKHSLGLVEYNNFLAGMMKQATYRYPHAKILEIGAGTGGATKSVLEAIGSTMSSYTYTDISAGFFKKAAEVFKAYSDKMTFKSFDVEKAPAAQGYELHSYDIIVASNVLHATASLQKTLEHTRQLLKPGGYLMVLEMTTDPIRASTIMGGLSGWWLGVDDGRKYTPIATTALWHSTLRKAGFGGVDAITPKIDDGLAWPFSIIASQAIDNQVSFLRRPLSSTSSSIFIDSLVILGTGSFETARIAEEVSDSLSRFCGKTTILNGLPTEAEALSLDPMSTFINLADLDSPIFKNLTAEKMDGMKRIFELAKHVLWITRGAMAEEPYHMASVAFNRSISNEALHISLNNLDISEIDDNVSKVIAEQLLRQCALAEWDDQQLLWSKEPETFLDHGKLMIPRIIQNVEQNNRLNSSRRVIKQTMPISSSNFAISQSTTSLPSLVEEALYRTSKVDQGLVRVENSSLMALRVASDAFLFLAVGKEDAAGRNVIALSTTNSRTIAPVASVTTDINEVNPSSESLLIAIESELLAASLLQSIPAESSILVHCLSKDRFLAAALSRQATTKAIRITFSCDAESKDDVQTPAWVKLSARAPRHVVRRILLAVNPTHFLDLTANSRSYLSDISLSIAISLPSSCKRINPSDIFLHEALLPQSFHQDVFVSWLEDAVAGARAVVASITQEQTQDMILQVDQIQDWSASSHVTSVVHWPVDGEVKVLVRPLDARNLFSQDKTYLLFGLTSQIGQSLCELMVSNGAGCVCLMSRNPKIDQRWLDSFQGTKATVKVFSMDLTSKESLHDFLETIRATCPPIGGIANGAMVLNDALFSSMSFNDMRDSLRPKIDGSYNLDQAFYNENLDFFVMFSSGACVVGNSGQTNYVAANGYLNGLARQRRRRGLAASTFDIGVVAGIGYVESAGQHVVDQLARYGTTVLSESDIRQAFVETIQAGKVSPKDKGAIPQAVVTTGVRTMTDGETNVTWYNNPIFSHCISKGKTAELSAEGQTRNTALPVAEQLSRVANEEEALELLQESFLAKLRIILQSADQEIEHGTPLVELGIDSLVAVEVRSWFLKELKVDIPVLKVVGGASLAEICELAMKKLPKELLAKIGTSDAAPQKPVVKQPLSQPLVQPKIQSTDTGSSSASEYDSSPGVPTPSGMNTPNSSITQMSKSITDFGKPSTMPMLHVPQATEASSRTFVKSEPISLGQYRFWFLRLLVEDQTAFNVTFYHSMTGNVRVGDLERAIRVVTARHEALRTCFIGDETEAEQASQNILARSPIRLERKKITSAEEAAAEYTKLKAHQFDLASGELLRLVLLTLSPTSHYLLVNYHHIIMDGLSFQVFMGDVEKVYNNQALGKLPKQYPEFSVAQRQAIEKGELGDELKYWQGVFPDGEQPPILPLLPMARTNSRVALTDYELYQVEAQLEPELMARIKSISKANRSTPFHFFLAAFKAMLFSFTDAQDLTIGIADANRNDSDVMNSIGFFLNLLTLRFHRQPDQPFADAIVEARNTAYGALEHSRLPFDVLLKELNVSRSSSYSPFFQAFFDYRQTSRAQQTWCNCQFDMQASHPGRTAYDITLDITDNSSDTNVTLRVQKGLYELTAANLLLETYMHFVDVLSRQVSLPLKEIPLFSEKQLARAVEVGRGPDLISDWPATLPHRIDQVVMENADKPALMDGLGSSLTYTDMSNRIEAISQALLNAGIGSTSRVLVFQQASVDWVCSMLAIMRIGSVYVPLDLRNPISRLTALANNCQPSAVLADSTTLGDAPQLNVALVIDVSGVPSKPSARVANSAHPDSPAAILYTSGSTGTPKGIMLRHSGIRNEMEGYTKTWKLGAERVLQQSAFTFDFSLDQMFTGLVNGGMVYIVPWSKRGDPLSITEIIRQNSITYTKVTPSEYSLWIQYGGDELRHASSWRFAFAGGEPLTKTVLQQFADLDLPQLRLHNSYGPAEISIASHKMEIKYLQEEIKNDEPVPCGYSLPNYTTYVLDEHLNPLPIGMPGEVVIGGAGVSLGYLNNKELTARQFVPNPYATPEYTTNGWTQMHRTGDIGHLQDDGSLVFRNRIAGDTQVKIRGLRIELRDIENNIISAAGGALKEAIVTLREGNPEFLVAHVVFAPQNNVKDKDAFLEHLLSRLQIPQYMIPVLAIPLDKLPLSNHFKVDRKTIKNMALPRRAVVHDTKKDAELTETMVQLRRVWRQVLGKDSEKLGLAITASTSFFMVGGNSLLVVRLQSQIRQVFNVAIPLIDLLSASTLGEMARKIEDSFSVDLVDWFQETAPPTIPSFLDGIEALQAPTNQGKVPRTVLLTGATGNVAKHLLPLLLGNPKVEKIHCLAVRDELKLIHSDKIVAHGGDLTEPLLGLTEDKFRALSTEVDVILHLGAGRSFWDNYHVLRPINVHSTKELVKLAVPRRIPIHFISSSGVLPREALGDGAAIAASSATNAPPADGADGYLATKWASERILERSAASLAIPTFIYRLLPSTQAQPSHSKQEVLDEFVRCVDLASALPDSTGWEGRFDLIPAHPLSQWLSESMISERSAATTTQFSHYESPIAIGFNELKIYLEEQRGDRGLERLPALKWMGRIKALGFTYVLASQEATVESSHGGDSGVKLTSRR